MLKDGSPWLTEVAGHHVTITAIKPLGRLGPANQRRAKCECGWALTTSTMDHATLQAHGHVTGHRPIGTERPA